VSVERVSNCLATCRSKRPAAVRRWSASNRAFAGDGDYHVKVDTVDLKRSAIASTNKVDSALTANSLTASNIESKTETRPTGQPASQY
jgi:hypothetical protein